MLGPPTSSSSSTSTKKVVTSKREWKKGFTREERYYMYLQEGQIITSVAGVTHEGRQQKLEEIVDESWKGFLHEVYLRHTPSPYDARAISVYVAGIDFTPDGAGFNVDRHIGFLPRQLSEELFANKISIANLHISDFAVVGIRAHRGCQLLIKIEEPEIEVETVAYEKPKRFANVHEARAARRKRYGNKRS